MTFEEYLYRQVKRHSRRREKLFPGAEKLTVAELKKNPEAYTTVYNAWVCHEYARGRRPRDDKGPLH